MPSLVEIGPVGSWEEDFKISSMYVSYFLIISLRKGQGPSFEQTWIPLIKALCQVWLKLAQWFWKRRFLNFDNVFFVFCNYLPLEKGGALHLNKLKSSSPKDALCQLWLKSAKWFRRRRWKCEKFMTTMTTTDKFWSEKLTWAFGSGELKMGKRCLMTNQRFEI